MLCTPEGCGSLWNQPHEHAGWVREKATPPHPPDVTVTSETVRLAAEAVAGRWLHHSPECQPVLGQCAPGCVVAWTRDAILDVAASAREAGERAGWSVSPGWPDGKWLLPKPELLQEKDRLTAEVARLTRERDEAQDDAHRRSMNHYTEMTQQRAAYDRLLADIRAAESKLSELREALKFAHKGHHGLGCPACAAVASSEEK